MILYNYDLDDRCYTIRLTAACLGVALEVVNLDIFPGKDHLSPQMLALNPAGRVPVLVDGDLVLTDPAAMMIYLSLKADGALQPQSTADLARQQEWLGFAGQALGAASLARAISLMAVAGDLDQSRALARTALRRMEDVMTRLTLTGEGYFAGAHAGLADLALFPAFALSRDYGIDHDEFPALRLWARRVRTLNGFITMPGIPDYH